MKNMNISSEQTRGIKALVSVMAQGALPETDCKALVEKLKNEVDIFALALATVETFDKPNLKRLLKLTKARNRERISLELDFQETQVRYQGQVVGQTKILFKSPLPGELQARLAIESAIDRFLEYLQKVHHIVTLEESDRHVQLFIPIQADTPIPDFTSLWHDFIHKVAFSTYGLQKHHLPGLAQTFISMLKSVTLSGRGFSTLKVPILNREQADVLAAWYFAVWRDTKKRQDDRQRKIDQYKKDLDSPDISDKEAKSIAKQLQDAEAMQLKEAEKYKDHFQKFFGKSLEEQRLAYQELAAIQSKLDNGVSKAELKKLQKQQEKLHTKLLFSQESVQQKLDLLRLSGGNPLEFITQEKTQNPKKFQVIEAIAKNFDKTATDQINGTRGDIFAQCIAELYRLLEMTDEQFDPLPPPLLTEQPSFEVRSPGDDSEEFCYSCGVVLDPKTAQWQVLRFIFERPSQRCQSASGEDRPHICASCAALAFASPLKVTDESIVLKLEPVTGGDQAKLKLKDYLRMLTNKELHLSAGKYIVLTSDKTQRGDSAAQKLGQVQYALAKVASIFPVEVLSDFSFALMVQSSESIKLASRHLIFIRGLMECYGQSIIVAGKDFNLTLGDAIRYVQQDLPYLADYTVTKSANTSNYLELEKIRALYWRAIQADLTSQGDFMNSDTQLAKRARLYRHVAALTGLTYAFANALESTAKKAMDKDDAEREVSKLIEKVDDAVAFCYYATLGDEKKTNVQAMLWRNSDNEFIYSQTKELLTEMNIAGREEQGEDGKVWLKLYADDVLKAYTYFAEKKDYSQEKDWKELTYQLKLSLYTRFPELVRKLKTTGDK